MKKVFILIATVMAFSGAQANDDLAASMKVIGQQFRVISVGIQSSNLTENELNAIEVMQKEIAASSLLYPDTATTDELKVSYHMLMAELMQMSLNLEDLAETAISQNPQDMSDITALFIEINNLRVKGHDLFRL